MFVKWFAFRTFDITVLVDTFSRNVLTSTSRSEIFGNFWMNANHPVLAWLENQLKDKKKTSLRAVKRDYAKLTGFISLSTQLTFPLLGLETLELKDLLFQNV